MAKPDPETHLLVAALAEIGVEAVVAPWDSPEDWAAYPLVVVRTPWDYFRRLPEFLAWAERTSQLTAFVNPYAVIEWNSHKAYLRELAADGIPTVPTLWLDQGAADGAARCRPRLGRGGGEAGGLDRRHRRAAGRCRRPGLPGAPGGAAGRGDVMVQPFVASVAQGEVSLVYFGGASPTPSASSPRRAISGAGHVRRHGARPRRPPTSWSWPPALWPPRRRPPPTPASIWCACRTAAGGDGA
jgi:hypothetical protein